MNAIAEDVKSPVYLWNRARDMGFFANTGTVWCLVELLLVPAWAAKVAAIAVSFVVNFSLSHFLVFRAQPRQNAD